VKGAENVLNIGVAPENFGGDVADVYLHALNRCIELAAASAAARMLQPGEPVPSVSDLGHSVKFGSLVCKSPEAVEKFIKLAGQMAGDLLRPCGRVLIVHSTVLRIRRTLNGEEIDGLIADTCAGFELAAESSEPHTMEEHHGQRM
jgi:hypothetical protein